MPVLQNDVIKSLTFLCLPGRHQATLDELHMLMQKFQRVITNVMFLNQNFLSIRQLQMMINFQLILTRMINPCALITFGTKYLNKRIYIVVNLVLNTFQNLLNFYFCFLTIIHIVIVYLLQSKRSAMMVTIT